MPKRFKSPNGQGKGSTFLVAFNLDDEQEARAWAMAQQLACPHGKRKHVLLGFLLALCDYQDITGVELNADKVVAMFMSGVLLNSDGHPTGRIRFEDLPETEPELIIGTADHADPEETRLNFAISMGDMFGDD